MEIYWLCTYLHPLPLAIHSLNAFFLEGFLCVKHCCRHWGYKGMEGAVLMKLRF